MTCIPNPRGARLYEPAKSATESILTRLSFRNVKPRPAPAGGLPRLRGRLKRTELPSQLIDSPSVLTMVPHFATSALNMVSAWACDPLSGSKPMEVSFF